MTYRKIVLLLVRLHQLVTSTVAQPTKSYYETTATQVNYYRIPHKSGSYTYVGTYVPPEVKPVNCGGYEDEEHAALVAELEWILQGGKLFC